MADKQALKDLQGRLAERLNAAKTQLPGRSWLAVETGSQAFLFPLEEAGEIFAGLSWVAVPHTRPWFVGVANLRGHLHGVVDLAAFLGLRPPARASAEPARDQSRLVAFNAALEINCALWVDRLAGLRNDTQLTRLADEPTQERPAFAGARFRDVEGRIWQELRLPALAASDDFLTIVG